MFTVCRSKLGCVPGSLSDGLLECHARTGTETEYLIPSRQMLTSTASLKGPSFEAVIRASEEF